MRIAVAMSGGVDSSVAALLLRRQGHEVVGVTMQLLAAGCAGDARRVAADLGIEFHQLEAAKVFDRRVVAPFVEAYGRGTTPNPCAVCNRAIKFGWLREQVRGLGCVALATGHYARIGGEPGLRMLLRGRDPAKDQSYFLALLPGDILEEVLFPLHGLEKTEVRRLAEAAGLPVAEKAESQDACFVPRDGLDRFLRERGLGAEGEIEDLAGRVLGRHPGVHAYTVGQRKGLGVAAAHPLYVVRKDARNNRLVVGPRSALWSTGLEGRNAVWRGDVEEEDRGREIACSVKIRSTARDVPCRVRTVAARVQVRFEEPQFGVAPGQLAAFYRGEEVLGGAWIERPVPAGEDAGCG